MERLPFEQHDAVGIDALAENTGRPIPGQSLTNSPDESYPWESPPEFTNFKDALEYITDKLLIEENYMPMMQSVSDGVPLSDITTQLLYVGFREGKWNPDLLLLLVEPVMYVLMALAEKADIQYVLYGDEEEDEEPETDLESKKAKNIQEVARAKLGNVSEIPQGALPTDIAQQIQSLDIGPGLLEKQTPPTNNSLLEKVQ
jgi:hypothetical protein|tara:strand:+ start:3359 stop:3961 length:603 start_codon:yes stop_codon:yes gene_type:complete